MFPCKALILILLALILISENTNTHRYNRLKNTNTNPYNYKFTLDCMDKENKECTRINLYAKNLYLNSHQ